MSGTERMKNNIFRRFFSYYKNGATFDFRGRSIFLIRGFMLYPCAQEGKDVFLFLDKSFYTRRRTRSLLVLLLSPEEYDTARRFFASCIRR